VCVFVYVCVCVCVYQTLNSAQILRLVSGGLIAKRSRVFLLFKLGTGRFDFLIFNLIIDIYSTVRYIHDTLLKYVGDHTYFSIN